MACAQGTAPGQADDTNLFGPGHWRLVVSPYTLHWRPSDEHRRVWALGAERQRSDNWLAGASYFRNSFGQPSAYLYVGKRYPAVWAQQPQLFVQWSAGLLYGYRGAFKDKVPFNRNGFAPGAVVSVGWQFTKQFSAQANVLGTAALMLQLSIDFR